MNYLKTSVGAFRAIHAGELSPFRSNLRLKGSFKFGADYVIVNPVVFGLTALPKAIYAGLEGTPQTSICAQIEPVAVELSLFEIKEDLISKIWLDIKVCPLQREFEEESVPVSENIVFPLPDSIFQPTSVFKSNV